MAQLLRPLGLLSLVAVADGIFARIRLRGGGGEPLSVRLEDLQSVRPAHVLALADHAQQVSVEAVDGLAQLLLGSPALATSAAAVLLAALLMKRAQARAAGAGRLRR